MTLPKKFFFLTLVFLVICIGPVINKKASADTLGSREEIIRVIEESTKVAQSASKSAGLPDFQPGAVVTANGIEITQKGQEILRKMSQQKQEIAVLIEESTKVAQSASKSAGLPDFQPGAVVTANGIKITQKGQDILKSQQPLALAAGTEKKEIPIVSKEKPQDLSQKLGSISDILKEEGQANAIIAPVIEDKGNDKGTLNNLLAISILGLSGKRSWSLIIGLILIVAAIFITMPKKKKIDIQTSANKALQNKIIDDKVMLKK